MEKTKKTISFKTVGLIFATYVSFALAYSFAARGTVSGFNFGFLFFESSGTQSKIIANVFVAALIGGIIPAIIFEFGLRLYTRPLEKTIEGLKKSVFRLRLFFMAGNIITFLLSFLYYAFPFLSVWGGILINFLVLSACLIVHLALEVRFLKDKSKAAYLVMQASIIYLLLFSVAIIGSALLESL